MYVTAYVVDDLPHTTSLILGQPFMRQHRCAVRFDKKVIHFEINFRSIIYRITRPYAEPACEFPGTFDTISASQLNSLNKKSVYVIQRDFKVQDTINPLLAGILSKFPRVMSGIPPDGTVHRESYCNIDLIPGATPKMLRSYRLTPLERKELDAQVEKMLKTVDPTI